MQRVRHRRSDLRITARRGETGRGQRWSVAAVDQIMSDARVVRLLGENRFEDRRRLLLVGKRFVGGRGDRIKGKCIKDRSLAVVGIILMKARCRDKTRRSPRYNRARVRSWRRWPRPWQQPRRLP